jgi:hypothetical protein
MIDGKKMPIATDSWRVPGLRPGARVPGFAGAIDTRCAAGVASP